MRIIGIIPVYNESDNIGFVLDHLLSQGIEPVVLDNGSTDGSDRICLRYKNRGLLWLEKLKTDNFDFNLILNTLYQTALTFQPDWVLLNAADEFLESPFPNVTLKAAIEQEDAIGCNLIQFNNFEFFPTEKDQDATDPDVRKRLKYYTWNDDLQFRCWKVFPGVQVSGTAGHYPLFPENLKTRIADTKYVLRHYRIRSYEHGLRKIFSERIPRYIPEEKKQGKHIHYDNFKPEPRYFIINSRNLTEYKDDNRWKVRKTFDWTWGVQGKTWAKPPKTRLEVRIASRFPQAVRIWKRIFLRNKRLAASELEAT